MPKRTNARMARAHQGERNPRAVMNEADVRELRTLRQDYGMTMPALAAWFGIAQRTAEDIVYRRRWTHVTD